MSSGGDGDELLGFGVGVWDEMAVEVVVAGVVVVDGMVGGVRSCLFVV